MIDCKSYRIWTIIIGLCLIACSRNDKTITPEPNNTDKNHTLVAGGSLNLIATSEWDPEIFSASDTSNKAKVLGLSGHYRPKITNFIEENAKARIVLVRPSTSGGVEKVFLDVDNTGKPVGSRPITSQTITNASGEKHIQVKVSYNNSSQSIDTSRPWYGTVILDGANPPQPNDEIRETAIQSNTETPTQKTTRAIPLAMPFAQINFGSTNGTSANGKFQGSWKPTGSFIALRFENQEEEQIVIRSIRVTSDVLTFDGAFSTNDSDINLSTITSGGTFTLPFRGNSIRKTIPLRTASGAFIILNKGATTDGKFLLWAMPNTNPTQAGTLKVEIEYSLSSNTSNTLYSRAYSIDIPTTFTSGKTYNIKNPIMLLPTIDRIPQTKWMKYLDDDTKLRDITLVGSHDAPAYGVISWAETQEMSVAEQLKRGVRAFDIRIDWWGSYNKFYLYHGPVYLGQNPIDHVLNPIRQFLIDNPSETVFITLKDEAKNNDMAAWKSNMNSTLDRYQNYILFPYYEDTTLEDARGKMIIFSRASKQPSGYMTRINYSKHLHLYPVNNYGDFRIRWITDYNGDNDSSHPHEAWSSDVYEISNEAEKQGYLRNAFAEAWKSNSANKWIFISANVAYKILGATPGSWAGVINPWILNHLNNESNIYFTGSDGKKYIVKRSGFIYLDYSTWSTHGALITKRAEDLSLISNNAIYRRFYKVKAGFKP